MAFVLYNPNPASNIVGDCTVRAVAKVTGVDDWDTIYLHLCIQGFLEKDMPSSNDVWGSYLYDQGFRRGILPDTCPQCYTVKDFCNDNPVGMYLLALQNHVVAVVDGDYYDNYDSGNEVPLYYWRKEF